MHILFEFNGLIPAHGYGGIQRVIWCLGKELHKMGHNITYLVKAGSYCNFANIINYDSHKTLSQQIPDNIDIIHFSHPPIEEIQKPFIITYHGNCTDFNEFNLNTVFVSKNHADRFNSNSYVYNGLDWDEYGKIDFKNKRSYFHFLGKAAWRVKNVRGAIDIIKATDNEKLYVLGGTRLNFKMGFQLILHPRIKFFGMINDAKKLSILKCSKGLIFPVRWHEPFGLAIIESLYCGCPVFGTPYGALPELVSPDFGFLSNQLTDFLDPIANIDSYSREKCHEYALENFNSKKMAESYLEKYTAILNGHNLNSSNPRLKKLPKKFLEWS